jgi:dipeptidyl-peptidase 4
MSDSNSPLGRSVEQSRITPEDVATAPAPGLAIPSDFAFSTDDRLLTNLASVDGTLTRQLVALDLATNQTTVLVDADSAGIAEDKLSIEEALRRERQRMLAVGVTSYAWATNRDRLVVPLGGGIYVQDGAGAPLRQIVASGGPPWLDARLSPDGNWVAYIQDAEVYVVSADGGKPRQLTTGAREAGLTQGVAEFIAQEEMGRSQGYWWSPDSRYLAFTEVDEQHIPIYRIVHQGKDEVGDGAQEDHRYPFAGQANARVRLAIVPLAGGEPLWLAPPTDEELYLARVTWFPDGRLVAQWENRDQTRLDLVSYDVGATGGQLLLREESEVWINLHDLLRPLATTGGFLWASERSGFRHLYLYERNGSLIRGLTSGDWQVDAVVGVDEERQLVYFTSTEASPLESQLHAVSFDGGERRRITLDAGTHTVVVDHRCERFVDVFHSIDRPPTVTVRSLADGAIVATVFDRPDPRVARLDLQAPELVSLASRYGVTLHGAIFRPPETFGGGPYPTIVSVYGGPHAQTVANSWRLTASLRVQYLRSLGYLVFLLDNRGSARRGLAFEGAIRWQLGHQEVADQVDGVRWLVDQGLTDPERVGIIGWSYGGFMAGMCLATAPETFSVAVAGAPVTNWDGYDTHYTERYMGRPEDNLQGYREASLQRHIGQIRGKLLLIHGLIDENVHFRHTARLINALIAARKNYDLLLFPDERHLPRKPADRIYLEERVRDFFIANL